jgi:23S rRNA (guanosine2251-2'-O)-methyltransferase
MRAKLCTAEEVERRCGSSAHQGVCASVGGYPYVGADELLAGDSPLIVALDQVQDPQNLGSICRTAECAGATGVVIPERRSAEVTPAVCKASAGAVEHMRIARVRNIADFLGDARDAGCWSYGASAPLVALQRPGGRRGAEVAVGAGPGTGSATVLYTEPDYSGGVVLVLGSEGSGLRPRVAGACDQLVSLPLRGRIESLGVAAATAALLYGILHDREACLDKAP